MSHRGDINNLKIFRTSVFHVLLVYLIRIDPRKYIYDKLLLVVLPHPSDDLISNSRRLTNLSSHHNYVLNLFHATCIMLHLREILFLRARSRIPFMHVDAAYGKLRVIRFYIRNTRGSTMYFLAYDLIIIFGFDSNFFKHNFLFVSKTMFLIVKIRKFIFSPLQKYFFCDNFRSIFV